MADSINVSVIDLLTFIRLVDRDAPTSNEAIERTGWSHAKVKRVLAAARQLGVKFDIPMGGHRMGESPRWRLVSHGPFAAARTRDLYDQPWMPKQMPNHDRPQDASHDSRAAAL